MRKVILDLAVTLDGFIEGPNGEIDWLTSSEHELSNYEDIFGSLLNRIDTIFYGRKSYELWGNYQPGEKAPSIIRELYHAIHSKKKYVFSSTKTGDDTAATFIQSNIKEKVQEMLQYPGKDIWLYGGGKLITTFINLGLVDVYRLAVYPVILGAGRPLFQDIKGRVQLKLLDTKSSPSGVILLNYEVVNKTALNFPITL